MKKFLNVQRLTFLSLILLSLTLSCDNNPASPFLRGSEGDCRYLPLHLYNSWTYSEHYYDDSFYTDGTMTATVIQEPTDPNINNYWLIEYDYNMPQHSYYMQDRFRKNALLILQDNNAYLRAESILLLIIGDKMNVGDIAGTSMIIDRGQYTFSSIENEITVPAGTFYNVRKLTGSYVEHWEGCESSWLIHDNFTEYYAENIGIIYCTYYHEYFSSGFGEDVHTYAGYTLSLNSYIINN